MEVDDITYSPQVVFERKRTCTLRILVIVICVASPLASPSAPRRRAAECGRRMGRRRVACAADVRGLALASGSPARRGSPVWNSAPPPGTRIHTSQIQYSCMVFLIYLCRVVPSADRAAAGSTYGTPHTPTRPLCSLDCGHMWTLLSTQWYLNQVIVSVLFCRVILYLRITLSCRSTCARPARTAGRGTHDTAPGHACGFTED